MFSGLAKNAIWPATIIVLALLGCVTALTVTGHLAATDVLPFITLVAGGVIGTTSAHVGAQAATNAVNATSTTPATSTAPTAPTAAAPATLAAVPTAVAPAGTPTLV